MVEISVVNQDAGDFMARSVAEEKQTVRLNQEFCDAQSPVFQTITNQVCDCCYIGTSWTTRNEADVMIEHLRLLASHDCWILVQELAGLVCIWPCKLAAP